MSQNPRCPTDTLTAEEGERLRVLVRLHGEKQALVIFGVRHSRTLYRAAAEQPVSWLTANTIRGRLDRI